MSPFEVRYSIAGYVTRVIDTRTGWTIGEFTANVNEHGAADESAERQAEELARRLNRWNRDRYGNSPDVDS
jgi:hypothetical protein